MKRTARTGALFFGLAIVSAALLPGQAPPHKNSPSTEARKDNAAEEDDLTGWKWANFIVLAGVLGYFGVRFGMPYFNGQTETINREITAARQRRAEAEARSAEVERKLANLGNDIDVLRKTVLEEQKVQAARMREQAGVELGRLEANAMQQIESLSKHARLDLRRHTSKLALELAEQRVRSRMNPGLQQALTGQFVEHLEA